MQPHPHSFQSHPSPSHTHIFRETCHEPSGATLRGKKQHRTSVGSDSCPRTRNPLDLPSGSDSSTLREGKYPRGYEFYNKWAYLKQARQALGGFFMQSHQFSFHIVLPLRRIPASTLVLTTQSHHVAHLSQSHTR